MYEVDTEELEVMFYYYRYCCAGITKTSQTGSDFRSVDLLRSSAMALLAVTSATPTPEAIGTVLSQSAC